AHTRRHLGGPPLVEDDAPHERDVEVANLEASPAHLAGRGEDLRDALVEDLAEGRQVALAALASELPATLLVLLLELVIGGLLGRRLLLDLGAQRGHPS